MKEVAPKFALNIYALLNTMFDVAFQYDLFPVSPIRSKLHKPSAERQEKPFLEVSTVIRIINLIEDEYKLLFALLASTGMRIGECIGLVWREIDFSQGLLSIEQSVWRRKVKAPKTKASARVFRLPDSLLEQLRKQRAAAQFTNPADFVFCQSDGRTLDPDWLRESVLYPAMDRAGVKRTARTHGFHIFRHPAGSIIYEKTGKMKIVQKALGHAQESTTSNVYVHARPEVVAEAVGLVAEEILPRLQTAEDLKFEDFTTGFVN